MATRAERLVHNMKVIVEEERAFGRVPLFEHLCRGRELR
jgi:hypothetical protein